MLAARRIPSKEIATRLSLSRRTVDNHLHRAYSKLGVMGRDELAESLGISPD
jgi:DNA-binding CsgD family transcriptional regulator